MPECHACAAKDEYLQIMRENYLVQVRHLENTIQHERKQTALIQEKLFMAIRLEKRNEVNIGPTPQINGKETHIRGVVSPMKQRATAEADSRARYWRAKAEVIEKNKPVEGLISRTEG